MANETVLTPEAFEKLKKEVEELKGPVRHRIAEAIREAKSHGDLKENAAYHEAKLNQTRLESRIAELEKILQLAKIVNPNDADQSNAHLGSSVRLRDLDYDDDLTIKLVSSYEADPAKDLISISSPMGAAIMGAGVGQEVEVDAPGGKQRYRILELL
jgi:transcription elongation factor GreA